MEVEYLKKAPIHRVAKESSLTVIFPVLDNTAVDSNALYNSKRTSQLKPMSEIIPPLKFIALGKLISYSVFGENWNI